MDAIKTGVTKTGEVLHKAVDATILDKSPHGTNVDGFVDTSKEVKAVADATVLDTHEKIVDGGINIHKKE